MHDDDMPMPDLGEEVRIPAGCQMDLYGGFSRRMIAEPYEEVIRKINEADPEGTIELRVLSGPPRKAEIVRFTIDVRLIGSVLEITDALEERWKSMEEEQREQLEGGGVLTIGPGFLGGGGFRLG